MTIRPTHINDLDLSVRSHRRLMRAGVETVNDLISMTKADLLALDGLGKRSLNEIVSVLHSYNLTLGMISRQSDGSPSDEQCPPRDVPPTCQNCRFRRFVGDMMFCRYNAPTVISSSHGFTRTVWPNVGKFDWCGRWESAI